MCKQGHDLTAPDAVVLHKQPDGRLKRRCRQCQRDHQQRMAATHPRNARANGGVHPLAKLAREGKAPSWFAYAYGTR